MPNAMLTATAKDEASTPAAPLMPQNHGVGLGSTALMKRIPVGKPKPISTPAGAITATEIAARTARGALSPACSTAGRYIGSAAREQAPASAHRAKTPLGVGRQRTARNVPPAVVDH